mmetsp:Transcript_2444/g.5704  ORF Transcript_2444/g.5704 Transcript_2444/m.5704 type:complete len:270 (+) Transcript_2444:549-1358(+)
MRRSTGCPPEAARRSPLACRLRWMLWTAPESSAASGTSVCSSSQTWRTRARRHSAISSRSRRSTATTCLSWALVLDSTRLLRRRRRSTVVPTTTASLGTRSSKRSWSTTSPGTSSPLPSRWRWRCRAITSSSRGCMGHRSTRGRRWWKRIGTLTPTASTPRRSRARLARYFCALGGLCAAACLCQSCGPCWASSHPVCALWHAWTQSSPHRWRTMEPLKVALSSCACGSWAAAELALLGSCCGTTCRASKVRGARTFASRLPAGGRRML